MKILSHYQLVNHTYFQKISRSSDFLPNLFPPKGNLVNAQQKKNTGKEKRKKQGGEKAKGKTRGGRKTFSKKPLEILLSAHARTSKAVISLKAFSCGQAKTIRKRYMWTRRVWKTERKIFDRFQTETDYVWTGPILVVVNVISVTSKISSCLNAKSF